MKNHKWNVINKHHIHRSLYCVFIQSTSRIVKVQLRSLFPLQKHKEVWSMKHMQLRYGHIIYYLSVTLSSLQVTSLVYFKRILTCVWFTQIHYFINPLMFCALGSLYRALMYSNTPELIQKSHVCIQYQWRWDCQTNSSLSLLEIKIICWRKTMSQSTERRVL